MAGKKIWAELSSSVQPWCLQKRDISPWPKRAKMVTPNSSKPFKGWYQLPRCTWYEADNMKQDYQATYSILLPFWSWNIVEELWRKVEFHELKSVYSDAYNLAGRLAIRTLVYTRNSNSLLRKMVETWRVLLQVSLLSIFFTCTSRSFFIGYHIYWRFIT